MQTDLLLRIGYADLQGSSLIGRLPYVGRSGRYLLVSSQYLKVDFPYIGLTPSNRDGIEKELDQLLIAESTARIRAKGTPSALSAYGQDQLREFSHFLGKWRHTQTWFPESG